jgi:CheY-like chemotaxis protein
MSQRILVFESDTAFAGEVKSNFERMGLLVDVAGDGPSGLELAAAHRPDLILLTIELPGMNGFLVCKKIKKTSELENVPLVILSSEVDQETFEQHKKLRTRADEYIRKPIGFSDLLSRVQSFVPHSNGIAVVDAAEETALDIEEAFSVGDDDVIVLADDDNPDDALAADEPAQVAAPSVHPPVEAVFVDGPERSDVTHPAVEAPAVLSPALSPAPLRPIARETPVPDVRHEARHEVRHEARHEVAPAPRVMPTLNNLRAPSASLELASSAELERIKRELVAAEEKVQAAEKRASLADQRASSAERLLDAAKRTGGASSRELLDLREQQNRKERELLDLREQVTARDKQMIEASDRSLAVERDLQDARETCSDLQRELEKKTEVVAALTADKDGIRKRLDDTKARAERSEAKAKELGTELDGLKARHQAEFDELRNQNAQADAAVRSEHAGALSALRTEHEQQSGALRAAHSSELERSKHQHAGELERLKQSHGAELDALQKQHAGKLAAGERAHADELSELREEHSVAYKSAIERVEQEKRTALESLRHELLTEHQARVDEAGRTHRTELTTVRTELETRHASDLSTLNDKHRQELARLGKLLSEAESRFALLEERHEETESARSGAETQLRAMTEQRDQQNARNNELSAALERAKAKSARDEEILERVRKAMAIGLGLLEEQKLGPDA